MELFEAIAKRHSYRGPFRDLPVDRADLRHIVEAGLLAPSGKNGQTTTFVIVDDADTVGRISSMEGAKTKGFSEGQFYFRVKALYDTAG